MGLEYFKDKKVCHISHSDLDGFGATTIGVYYIQPIASSFVTHNTSEYDLCDYDLDKYLKFCDVFVFTDFSPTLEVVEKIKQVDKDIMVFDHHVSRLEDLKVVLEEDFIYDSSRCGTKIFFDWLTTGSRVKKCVYEFVELVNVYDLFQMNSALWKKAKGLNNVLWGMTSWFSQLDSTAKSRNFIDQMLFKFDNNKYFSFDAYEEEIIARSDQKEKDNYALAKKSLRKRVDSRGNKYGYFECVSKHSIVATWIQRDNPELDYIITHSTYGEPQTIKPKVSLRSTDEKNIDCSLIAKLHGGGGHKQAAGIEFTSLDFFEKVRSGEQHLI